MLMDFNGNFQFFPTKEEGRTLDQNGQKQLSLFWLGPLHCFSPHS